jgi:CBS domain-containing protein
MSSKQQFLKAFRELEQYLRVEYDQGDYRESTFMGTLFRVRGKKEHAIIAHPHYFDILQQAAQMRNIITHNEDVCIPTDRFTKRFVELVAMITHPLRAVDVMTPLEKVQQADLDHTIGETMEHMRTSGFSKMPVIKDGQLIGVFTERALYYYLSLPGMTQVSRDQRIKDLLEAIDLDGNPAPYFDYLPKRADVYQALAKFRRGIQEKNKLGMLFVTQSGHKDERILGIMTLADLAEIMKIG